MVPGQQQDNFSFDASPQQITGNENACGAKKQQQAGTIFLDRY